MRQTHLFTKDSNFDALKAGLYEVAVLKCDWVEPNSPKNGYYKWELIVDSGEHTGRHVWMNTVVCAESAKNFMLKNALIACGIVTEEDAKADEFEIDFDTDDVLGCKFTVELVESEWDGKPKNDVKKILF